MKNLTLLFALITTFQVTKAQDLYCATYGNKKDIPVLFLHGGPGYNCASFEVSTAKQLSENGFYVIVYDRRGEGRSTNLNAKFNFQETFQDINLILKKYNIKKINLIGHSFGGIIATLFTEKNPEKVNAIVLASAPVSLQETFKTILTSCRKIYTEKQDKTNLNYIDMIEKMDTTSAQYFAYSFGHAMQNGFYSPKNLSNEAKIIYENSKRIDAFKNVMIMTNEAPTGFLKNENYTSINLSKNLKKLTKNKTKIFGIYGKEDGLYSEKQVNDLANILESKNLKYLDNCSHNIFIDQQKFFIESLKSWLK
jgi:proline iminopeptidase